MKSFLKIFFINIIFQIISSNRLIGRNKIKDISFILAQKYTILRSLEPATKILMGFDQYTFNSNTIRFFAYTIYPVADVVESIDFTLTLIRSENADRKDGNCALIRSDDFNELTGYAVLKYDCSAENIQAGFSRVEVTLDNNVFEGVFDYAQITRKNLQDQIGIKLSDKGFFRITDCELNKENLIITGTNSTPFNDGDGTLYVIDSSSKIVNVPFEIDYKGGNTVEMKLNPKVSFQAHFDETLGMVFNSKNFLILFEIKGDYDYLNYTYVDKNDEKNESGILGGAFVAIILACILF